MLADSLAWSAAARAGRRIGHAVEAHQRIGSTNDRARALLDGSEVEGIAVVAEEQTAGRGRRGRTWSSPPGRNLTMSVALQPRLDAADAWQLGLAAALAAWRACGEVTAVALKWPNDLVAPDGRKLGGLLAETSLAGDRLAAAVIGIGINVNWPRAEMPAEIAVSATSLSELAGRSVDRVALLGALLDALDGEVARIEAGESPLARYRAACSTLGASVTVEVGGRRIEGVAVGLDEAGALIVAAGDERVAVTSGEVTRVRSAVPA